MRVGMPSRLVRCAVNTSKHRTPRHLRYHHRYHHWYLWWRRGTCCAMLPWCCKHLLLQPLTDHECTDTMAAGCCTLQRTRPTLPTSSPLRWWVGWGVGLQGCEGRNRQLGGFFHALECEGYHACGRVGLHTRGAGGWVLQGSCGHFISLAGRVGQAGKALTCLSRHTGALGIRCL